MESNSIDKKIVSSPTEAAAISFAFLGKMESLP
jgi:hypothetical protein